jgi:hypothetical protein
VGGKELKDIAEINPKSKKLPESFIYIDLESVEKGNYYFKKILSYRMHQVEHKDY